MLSLLLAMAAVQVPPAQAPQPAAPGWQALGGFIGVRVSSLPNSVPWYRDVLGFELVASNEQYGFAILRRGSTLVELNGGGVRAAAAERAPVPTGPNKFGLVVSDFDRLKAELEAKKIPLLGKIIQSDADGMRTLAIEDPDRNLLQFFGR